MRVALVGPYPPPGPLRINGGVEAAAFYLAQGLKMLGNVDLHVVSATKRVQSPVQASHGGVTVHYIPVRGRRIVPNMILDVFRLRRPIDTIQPDVVHGQSPWATLAGLRGGYPTVYTIHGVIHREGKYYGNGLAVRLNTLLRAYLTNKAISRGSHSIAVSSYVRSEFQDIARSGITVIPNAVEDRFFELCEDEVPDRLLYVGFVSRLKNVLGLIRAFEGVKRFRPNAHLVIAGSIRDQSYHAEALDYVNERGLAESVQFLGLVDQDRLLCEYARAAIVCTFSWHESFSLTVAQAMAAGKPVVSSDSGGPSDLVADGETGFLVPCGDEKAFAERLLALLSDCDLRRRFGARGREVANERFRKEVVAARTLGVYEEVISRAASAAARRSSMQ